MADKVTLHFTCLPLQGPRLHSYCTSLPANNMLSNNHWTSKRITTFSVVGFVFGF